MVADVRKTYISTADVALDVVRRPEVEASWDQPSALAQWRVSGLTGHLARALTTVEQYLDAGAHPEGQAITPAQYYALAVDSFDLDSALHQSIRRRGDDMAAAGYVSTLRSMEAVSARLRARLHHEPVDRRVAVLNDAVLALDDYLATRVVELVVHVDDLAVSLGVPTPDLPHDALQVVINVLIDTTRRRNGDLAIVRALARRERDVLNALRVF